MTKRGGIVQMVKNTRLIALRTARSLTQSAVASRIGISQRTLSHYENGYRTPSIKVMKRLSDFYGVEIVYLFLEKQETGDDAI